MGLKKIVGDIFRAETTLGIIKINIVQELTILAITRYMGLKNPLPFIGAKIGCALANGLCQNFLCQNFSSETIPPFILQPASSTIRLLLIYKAGLRLGVDRLNFITLIGISSISAPASILINYLSNKFVSNYF